jgi:hypothetical protein
LLLCLPDRQLTTVGANLNIDPEETAIAIRQASRFSEDCRVYAPMYRQVTVLGFFQPLDAFSAAEELAYADVLDAWRAYLADFNDGRGVVLIGHSQGSGLLARLIQEEIDGRPSQRKLLVSALLPGANVKVRKGGNGAGGSFKHVKACKSASDTGCVVAYSSFKQPPPENTLFGRMGTPSELGWPWLAGDPDKERVLCVDPAALVGNRALRPYFTTAPFPPPFGFIWDAYSTPLSAPTPWVEFPDLYKAHCESANGANWLQVDDIGGPADSRPRVQLSPVLGAPWGLHVFDLNLPLGNLVELVGDQANAYVRRAGLG